MENDEKNCRNQRPAQQRLSGVAQVGTALIGWSVTTDVDGDAIARIENASGFALTVPGRDPIVDSPEDLELRWFELHIGRDVRTRLAVAEGLEEIARALRGGAR